MLKQLLFVLTLCLVAVAMASAQDNLAGPWARYGADNAATASSTTPYRFSAHGPKLAWDVDLAAHGLTKVYGRSSLVFDESSNVYLSDESGFCASFDKDGNFRWKTAIGNAVTSTAPVVGNDAIYVMGFTTGVGYDVYSLNRATGAVNWTFNAPEATSTWSDAASPALYNGKLYVVTSHVAGNRQVRVRQVNAATGAVDWSNDVATWDPGGSVRGTCTFVPDVFGAGLHGLYVQCDAAAAVESIYAIKLDTGANAASLEWSKMGGHVSATHVIYSPAYGGRIYAATWDDYGNTFYAYDAVTGECGDPMFPETHWAVDVDTGHGWHDFRALVRQPDPVTGELSRVFAGGFGGDYVLYADDGAGNVTASPLYDGPDYYGEGSTVGGLAGAGEGVMIALTRTDATIPTPTNVRFVAIDVTGASGTYGEIWDYDTGWEPGGHPGSQYAASGGPVLGPDGKIYFATQQGPGGDPPPTNPIPQGHLMAWEPLVDISGGDGDGNGVVDGLDLTGVITAFGTVQGDALFSWNYDFDYNGTIDGLDLTVVITNWTLSSSAAPEASAAAKPGKRLGNVRKGR